jgi:hypothetical protein
MPPECWCENVSLPPLAKLKLRAARDPEAYVDFTASEMPSTWGWCRAADRCAARLRPEAPRYTPGFAGNGIAMLLVSRARGCSFVLASRSRLGVGTD